MSRKNGMVMSIIKNDRLAVCPKCGREYSGTESRVDRLMRLHVKASHSARAIASFPNFTNHVGGVEMDAPKKWGQFE